MNKKKTILIIVISIVIVAVIYFVFLKKGNKNILGFDKYEGKYIYTDYDGTGDNSPTRHTWLIKDGTPMRWDSTGISGDKNTSGNVYDVRVKVTKEEFLKYF
jgi:hypothetical protein